MSEQFETLESAREAFVALADEIIDVDSGLHKAMLYKIDTMEDGEIVITDIESMSWQDAVIIVNKNGF
jgi:dihydropteroate synthase